MWIAWNILVICNYLNLGLLDRVSSRFDYFLICQAKPKFYFFFRFCVKYDPAILNLNTGKKSWWFANNVGCRKQIADELEQLQYQQQLNEIRRIIESQQEFVDIYTASPSSSVTVPASPQTSTMLTILAAQNSSSTSTMTTTATTVSTVVSDTNTEILQNPLKKKQYLDTFIQANCAVPFHIIEILHSATLIIVAVCFYLLCIFKLDTFLN
jgi:hypothetical protein